MVSPPVERPRRPSLGSAQITRQLRKLRQSMSFPAVTQSDELSEFQVSVLLGPLPPS